MAIKKILVANRSEIAIRIFRAANELGLRTVAVWAEEDKLALHKFKADEAYLIGRGPHIKKPMGPIESYLSIEEIIRVAKLSEADAIHPGYGLLSESPEFADACDEAGIIFIGPTADTMRRLGNKVMARDLATEIGVPVVPATTPLPEDDDAETARMAGEIGYPLMLKASWGGGGRGMRVIRSEADLAREVLEGRREAKAAFGKDEVYLEKLIERARHVEVQILGDTHGNAVHLFERDCSIQRRNQKVVERAPAPYLVEAQRKEICDYGLKIANATKYRGAGTIEFLMDMDSGNFYFIEVNPRIQVEHTVTEEVTGIDIVKAQIRILEGAKIGSPESGVPKQEDIVLNGHAMQCRITTEDPEHNFIPDYGRIIAYRGATGFGIRLDGGTAYAGAVITRFYDPLLEKITAWAPTSKEVIARMDRALREFRIRGVATNLTFLEAIIGHAKFKNNTYTTKFIDETPELFEQVRRGDRATKILTYLADVTVNGHPETKDRPRPPPHAKPVPPHIESDPPEGTKQRLDRIGPEKFAQWMRNEQRVLLTDTTMRDAHQSLLATRMRTHDITQIAPVYARALPNLLSLECWGGATFDVAMRFLTEDPWERLAEVRKATPNILLQMLLRGANGVGYTNYPDNVVKHFVAQAKAGGMDLFRVFDCLNWVENMRVAMDAVREEGGLCEAAICYTGDLQSSARSKYDLKYYVDLASELERAGAHIIAVKDMAGLLKPAAATQLFSALRDSTDLPIHFHTHDTSGISAATVLAAVHAGADAVDAAMDAFSGNTSQPCLGSIVEALKGDPRDPGLDPAWIRRISFYWEAVRAQYAAFESDLKGPASEVYLHEMPGGQFTNLKEQARSLGLETRWHEVAQAYADANQLFGDIVKVTPSSKVVGDMALMMVSQDLTTDDVANPERDVSFPASVVSMMKGDLGQPPGGWPEGVQTKALKGEAAYLERPGALLPPADLAEERKTVEAAIERAVSEAELSAYLMYPKVFTDFAAAAEQYGPVSKLPTPAYFYGMEVGEQLMVDLEPGVTLVIDNLAVSAPGEDGMVTVFFELNGQPRRIKAPDRTLGGGSAATRRKAEPTDRSHVGAPMPGVISAVSVEAGQHVEFGDNLVSIEAMKMESVIHADQTGTVAEVLVKPGDQIDAKDLLVVIKGDAAAEAAE